MIHDLSVEETAKKVLKHLRSKAGQQVPWKELANATGARPERVKDALAYLTGVQCSPIVVSGSGCSYANSKVRRRSTARDKEAQVATRSTKQSLDLEVERIREGLMDLAARCDELIIGMRSGAIALPCARDAHSEGVALRALREERGVTMEVMARWLGKTQAYLADLEEGRRAMTEAEAREFVKELRMDGAVFNARLGAGRPVFPWSIDPPGSTS